MSITIDKIESLVVAEFYFTAMDGAKYRSYDSVWREGASEDALISSLEKLTICVLVLENGFTVTGESAPINPENFDAEIGKQVARRKAVDKLWPILGYAALDKGGDAT